MHVWEEIGTHFNQFTFTTANHSVDKYGIKIYQFNILTKCEATCPIGSQQSRIGLFVGAEIKICKY